MEVNALARNKLLRELSAVQFAAWELHLYLDTHKCDEKAKELHKKYVKRESELKAEYEECYGPLYSSTESGENWIKNPWPWDYKEADC